MAVDHGTFVDIDGWSASQYFIRDDSGRRIERWAITCTDPITNEFTAVTWRATKAAAIAYIDDQLTKQGCAR